METKITELIQAELTSANSKFPPFRSEHEGYAVLREEAEETVEAMMSFMKSLERSWQQIKKNELTKADISVLSLDSFEIKKEAIKTAAMCEKFQDFYRRK